ncbi:DUF2065 family protein [Oceanicella actignis]|uniref:DUF2065 domain-containing protein n=1 Tax=Oceanicella actignis TaxID=1189325 RepID=A0A1M7SBK0_9RHOB|nr:DUF2065 family protein [Oceanicella actignis]TYO91507.1 uncharacterized protein DUF2065 [Oceanicella actignis]SET26953.1 hypothetical protein SAMN04488119_103323 [Oceanicella actignis]SHN55881.1 hypothetical protein SAMN05216200_102185 [Oceanicella actignis]
MRDVVFAIGAVLAFEGLMLALAPGLVVRALAFLQAAGVERRRMLGLGAAAAGVALLMIARS